VDKLFKYKAKYVIAMFSFTCLRHLKVIERL
jgi:hypothetical protein